MKLSKLYSNRGEVFGPVVFTAGLNVVLAEIRLPQNKKRDTHNLGKTTLGRLIDFMFLSKRDPKFFLFKLESLFKDFIFFMEIELEDGSYLTVRRSVDDASRIAFKKHHSNSQEFADIPSSAWDHYEMPLERAREMLDSLLDWRAVKPWSYRKGLGYLLRSQDDFRDVFQLRKFASSHGQWKPYLANLLGFDGKLVESHYAKEESLAKAKAEETIVEAELGDSVESLSKIEGILLLKEQEATRKQQLLDAFDFRSSDKQKTKQLVDDLDERIAELNSKRYLLSQTKKKVQSSLEEDEILFEPEAARKVFEETGILFAGQIKKDFEQLIEFNRAITNERRGYLEEELKEVDGELKRLNTELNELNKKRSEAISFLSTTDVFVKYREVSGELVSLKTDIAALKKQQQWLHRLQELRTQIRTLKDEMLRLQAQLEQDVEDQNADNSSLFSIIRLYFNEIVEEVISRKGLLSVSPNQQGHLEFKAEILDQAGNATSADLGTTYRKLLCVAFDLSVVRARLGEKFPRFVYHDGVFEALDDRKKLNLLSVLRRYADLGIQPIVTLIDSDIPVLDQGSEAVFTTEEIVLSLHDEGDSGRLFRMRSW